MDMLDQLHYVSNTLSFSFPDASFSRALLTHSRLYARSNAQIFSFVFFQVCHEGRFVLNVVLTSPVSCQSACQWFISRDLPGHSLSLSVELKVELVRGPMPVNKADEDEDEDEDEFTVT